MRIAMLSADANHRVDISFAPSFGIAERNDYDRCLLDLRLIVGRNPQFAALFRTLDYNEPPRLKVVAAGRLQPGDNNFSKVLCSNRYGCKSRRGASLSNHCADGFLMKLFCHLHLQAES